MGIGLFSPW